MAGDDGITLSWKEYYDLKNRETRASELESAIRRIDKIMNEALSAQAIDWKNIDEILYGVMPELRLDPN